MFFLLLGPGLYLFGVGEGGQWLKWLSVAALCALKFVPGVLLGVTLGLELWEQVSATTIGGVSGVFLFTYYGAKLRDWIARKRKKNKTLHDTQTVRIGWKQRFWNKYGLAGAAFLTPPVLSPPVGVGLALSFGTPKRELLVYMVASMVFWGLAFAFLKHPLFYLLHWVGFLR